MLAEASERLSDLPLVVMTPGPAMTSVTAGLGVGSQDILDPGRL